MRESCAELSPKKQSGVGLAWGWDDRFNKKALRSFHMFGDMRSRLFRKIGYFAEGMFAMSGMHPAGLPVVIEGVNQNGNTPLFRCLRAEWRSGCSPDKEAAIRTEACYQRDLHHRVLRFELRERHLPLRGRMARQTSSPIHACWRYSNPSCCTFCRLVLILEVNCMSLCL